MMRATLTGSALEKLGSLAKMVRRVPEAMAAVVEATGKVAVAEYHAGFAAERSPYGDSWGTSLFKSGALANPQLKLRPGGWILSAEEHYAFVIQYGWIPGLSTDKIRAQVRADLKAGTRRNSQGRFVTGQGGPALKGKARRFEIATRVKAIVASRSADRVPGRVVIPSGKDAGLWSDPIWNAGRAAVLKVFNLRSL